MEDLFGDVQSAAHKLLTAMLDLADHLEEMGTDDASALAHELSQGNMNTYVTELSELDPTEVE